MITDGDITKLKETFVTKEEFKEEIAEVRVEIGEVSDKLDSVALAVGRIENTLDGISGAIQDLRTENGAGTAHLIRHDRQIEALATNVTLPN